MQRNAALRQHSLLHQVWDEQLSSCGEGLDRSRREFFRRLEPEFREIATQLLPDTDPNLAFESGWDRGERLQDVFRASQPMDLRRGYTGHGPHHADLRLTLHLDGSPSLPSHGQQKVLVIALRLAQLRLFIQHADRPCVLLADDLAAELDSAHQQRILAGLEGVGAQVFMTALTDQLGVNPNADAKVFHVEHGQLLSGRTPKLMQRNQN